MWEGASSTKDIQIMKHTVKSYDYDSDSSVREFSVPHKLEEWMKLKSLDPFTIADNLRRIKFMFQNLDSDNYRLLFNLNNSGRIINNMQKHIPGPHAPTNQPRQPFLSQSAVRQSANGVRLVSQLE